MYTRTVIAVVFATFASFAAAAPLNINLGAYSPALVVGDGALTFQGAAEGAAAAAAEGAAIAKA
ncbi:hypothetical protein BKA67DRAFT_654353 [Truncatella angustata]|uniref:Uncharacterized protein n=1 Tax=Truncatella angustata TaxID=152316 RepID=A0A9P8UXL4_9PEZI|nr:uncharacterized protein BKA67DRAFT_654353 [Truncatella angustata]KAH6661224.1 hypothetical protein BKA67DRAFT_654353 [Truncatella angustata]